MCVLNFRSLGPTVQPAECKHNRHTDPTENITSSTNTGGKNGGFGFKGVLCNFISSDLCQISPDDGIVGVCMICCIDTKQ